jgi:hypothetical protein
MVSGATLLGDQTVELAGRPARRLTFRPGPLSPQSPAGEPEADDGGRTPFVLAVSVWLDDGGTPVAFERSFDFALGPALTASHRGHVALQQVGGRLLGAAADETYTGSALVVFGSRDDRSLRVTAVE